MFDGVFMLLHFLPQIHRILAIDFSLSTGKAWFESGDMEHEVKVRHLSTWCTSLPCCNYVLLKNFPINAMLSWEEFQFWSMHAKLKCLSLSVFNGLEVKCISIKKESIEPFSTVDIFKRVEFSLERLKLLEDIDFLREN